MKKNIITILVICTALLISGCIYSNNYDENGREMSEEQVNEHAYSIADNIKQETNNAVSEQESINDLSKAQRIDVVSPETSEVIKTITDRTEIEDFVSALAVDEWAPESQPEGAAAAGIFNLYQEKTIKAGETETDGTLYEIGTITVYDAPYIAFRAAGFDITFKISEKTADYLKSYFE